MEVEKLLISNLKLTGTDRDYVSVKLLKRAACILSAPIFMLINRSFEAGVFPSILKLAEVVPVFKSGVRKLTTNYRPISLLPVLSKLFERAMSSRVVDYLTKFSIVTPCQFGFRKSLSTADAITSLTEFIYTSLNDKNHALSIFVDLSKAFDTINHEILLSKLFLYGIRAMQLD